MRITRIAVQNFLGIDAIDLAIERPVVLIAGRNCAGKSSIANSLRFVLTDDLCRVSHKKNIKALLREGAKLGSVTVGVVNGDGEIIEHQRSAVTGHYTSSLAPPEPHPALQYLLDPPAFLALSGNERREFLFRLMGVSVAQSAIRDELEKRGHDPALLKLLAPQLRQGFTLAHTEVQGLARELKGQYRGVTGENYGEVKAESWEAKVPEAPAGDIEALHGELAALEASIGQAQAEFGAVRARAEERERLAERLTRTQTDAGHMEEYEAIEQAVRQQLDKLAAKERRLTDEFREAEGKATFANIPQGAFHPCPVCGAALVYDRGHLKPGRPSTKQDMEALAYVEEDVTARKQALKHTQDTRRTKESELRYASESLGRAKNAKEMLASLEAPQQPQAMESASDIVIRLEALKQGREKLRAEIQAHEQAREAAAEASSKTERARALHEEIKALAVLIADLAPDGLPAELLEKAMGPINARLADSAAMTGWLQITIDTDEIWLSGIASRRPLALASDSERWRATAMIAEAIAALSGIKIFVLDGGDVVGPNGRAMLISWLSSIANDHETIILLMTLKEPPVGMPQNVQTLWLGEAK